MGFSLLCVCGCVSCDQEYHGYVVFTWICCRLYSDENLITVRDRYIMYVCMYMLGLWTKYLQFCTTLLVFFGMKVIFVGCDCECDGSD